MGTTILVVDDEADIAEITRLILQTQGYNVATVRNGLEAWEYLENGDNERPDLVISDVMMPVMDGRELCRLMQANPSYATIPIVLMSGAFIRATLGSCRYAAFIEKPFDLAGLLTTIGKVVGRQPA